MFTGLVQAVGGVYALEPRPFGARLLVSPGAWDHSPSTGDSICVSGCCLTLAEAGRAWAFDLVHETLAKTKLGGLRAGDRVNLEHSVTPTTLMGGHFVQGHVDGVGRVSTVQAGDDWRLGVALDAELMPFMTPKGSVCLDGVSLTIAGLDRAGRTIEIALIPTTLERTTLGRLKAGDPINVEADVLAKTIVNVMRNFQALPSA